MMKRLIIHRYKSGTQEASQTWGARCIKGTFSFRKNGHFLKIKRVFLCLLQSLGGGGARASSAPGPYVYDTNV